MGIECTIFAIEADRYPSLRNDPKAVTDEVLLRKELAHLAFLSQHEPAKSEVELLAEMRAERNAMAIEDPEERSRMATYYTRIDTLIDAALARGDRKLPFEIGKDWDSLNRVLTDGEGPDSPAYFISGGNSLVELSWGGKQLGEDVGGYGPPVLQDPAAVAAFAAYLADWSPERYVTTWDGLPAPEDDYIKEFNRVISSQGPEDQKKFAKIEVQVRKCMAAFFARFKTYIVDAATRRSGMLIWID